MDRLLDQLDLGHTGRVAKGQFAASQIDWGALQKDHSQWLECVRRAFDEFDTDGDGVCSVDEIVRCLKAKLPLTEVYSCNCSSPHIPCCSLLLTFNHCAVKSLSLRQCQYWLLVRWCALSSTVIWWCSKGEKKKEKTPRGVLKGLLCPGRWHRH